MITIDKSVDKLHETVKSVVHEYCSKAVTMRDIAVVATYSSTAYFLDLRVVYPDTSNLPTLVFDSGHVASWLTHHPCVVGRLEYDGEGFSVLARTIRNNSRKARSNYSGAARHTSTSKSSTGAVKLLREYIRPLSYADIFTPYASKFNTEQNQKIASKRDAYRQALENKGAGNLIVKSELMDELIQAKDLIPLAEFPVLAKLLDPQIIVMYKDLKEQRVISLPTRVLKYNNQLFAWSSIKTQIFPVTTRIKELVALLSIAEENTYIPEVGIRHANIYQLHE